MQQYKAHRTITRRRAWPLAIIAGGIVLSGLPVSSQAASTCTDQNCPADFIQLVSPEIQATKTSFKFQARISQAKLPVDDVEFSKVIVKLRDGTNTYCSQPLTKVKVRDSVLNIEVGPDTGMTCSMPLEDVIAGKNGLGFQICINNEENCLKPIALSSVPYSIKAEYARRAQQAFEADVAAQAHYAHRIAADLDLLQAPTIGTGYYDFHTPLSQVTVPGLNIAISNKEGVMQWTPVATAEKKLNIVLKNEGSGATPATFSRLEELKLHAVLTRGLGKLEVSEGTKLFSTLDVTGATTMASTLAVTGATTLASTLAVTGATTLNSTLLGKGAATLQSTLAVTGATTLASTLAATGATTLGNTLAVTGATTLNSTLLGKGATTLQSTLAVTGATTLGSTLAVTGNTSLSTLGTSGAATLGSTLAVTGATSLGNTLQVTGGTNLGGTLDVGNGLTTLAALRVPSTGSATFDGSVTFNGPVTLPAITSGSFTTLSVPLGGLRMGPDDNFEFGSTNNNVAAPAQGSTIAGGASNIITSGWSLVGSGTGNTAGGNYSVVGGGQTNTTVGETAVVGAGRLNTASGTSSFVGAGASNTASGIQSGVMAGWQNHASGGNAMVAGGVRNVASGDTSFAAGRRAQSLQAGAFTWADSTDVDFLNNTVNGFRVRANGGVFFHVNAGTPTATVKLDAGASAWSTGSDRNIKHDIAKVNPKAVLEKLETVPVSTWRYNGEVSGALHMGPMAQDFYAAFGLGAEDTHITTVDADGVALAAVKGVHAVTKEQQLEITELKGELKSLRERNTALEARLTKLESSAGKGASGGGLGMFGNLGLAGFAGLGLVLVAGRRQKALP